MDNKTHFQDLNNNRHLYTDVKTMIKQVFDVELNKKPLYFVGMKDGIEHRVSRKVYADVNNFLNEEHIRSRNISSQDS